jgi:Flp pilus assembly protein TadG
MLGYLGKWQLLSHLADGFRSIGRDRRGVAAVEFGIITSMLSVLFLNAVDLSLYMYQRMQVENAAQMGVQAAWKACDLQHLPATINCSGLTTAISNGIASTSLHSNVTLPSGSPSEAYYCPTSSGTLQYVSNVSSKPADCSATGFATTQPADYITVSTQYTYASLFSGLTVVRFLATPITTSSMMRLN